MRMRILTLAVLLMVLALLVSPACAGDYDRVFDTTMHTSTDVQLGNPAGGSIWRNVVSKYNQPRDVVVGSNPHRGVDIDIWAGNTVYAVYDGYVERVVRTAGDNNYLLLRHPNGGTTFYTIYLHIDPADGLAYGDQRLKGDPVGTIRTEPNHLHMGVLKYINNYDPAKDRYTSNTPYWRNVSAWDNGERLDFLCREEWVSSTNTFQITGYSYRADANSVFGWYPLRKADIWHRKVGTTQWRKHSMTVVSGSNNRRWQFNLGPHYYNGDWVEVVAIGYRESASDPDFPGGYDWGVWQPYFRHPSDNPAEWPSGFSKLLVEIIK